MRGWHCEWRESRKNGEGKHALSIGLRIGYWPCLRAVYAQACFWTMRFEIWYGEDMHPLARRARKI